MSSSNANSTDQSTDRLDSFSMDSTAASPSQPFVPTWYRALTVSAAGTSGTAGALVRPGVGELLTVTRGDGVRLLRDGRGDTERRSAPTGVGPPVADAAAGTVGRNTGGAACGTASRSLPRNDTSAITRSTASAPTPSSTTTHGADANTRAARDPAAPSGRTAIRSPLVPTDATA